MILLIDLNELRYIKKGTFILESGILYVASVLEDAGHRVRFLSLGGLVSQGRLKVNEHFHSSAAKIITKERIPLIGFTTRCDTYPSVINIARECKRINPNSKIILGGPQATFTDTETLKAFPFIDIIVRNEAEQTTLELVERLKQNRSLNGLPGITYRDNSRIIRNKDRELIKDLDSLPLPAYHLAEEYLPSGQEPGRSLWSHIQLSRGCPYDCIFCFKRKTPFRERSVKNVVEEVKFLVEKYEFRNFLFRQSDFLLNKKRAKELCDVLLREKLNIRWAAELRWDNVNMRMVERMKSAGCERVILTIESLSVEKRVSKILSSILGLISLCQDLNMSCVITVILGFPGEKKLDSIFEFILKLSPQKNAYILLDLLSPLPGTPLLRNNKNGLIFNGNFIYSALNENRENQALIKKYPVIFSCFYIIEPKFISGNFYLEDFPLLESLLRNYSLSLYLITKDLKIGSLKLWFKMKEWLERKRIKCQRFATFNPEVDFKHNVCKFFPEFVKSLYPSRGKNFNSLCKIINLEERKFNLFEEIRKENNLRLKFKYF